MARVVFDLDGTLVDSAPDLHAMANRILAARGLDPVTLVETRSFVGQGVKVFVAKLCAARGIAAADQPGVLAEYLRLYETAVGLTVTYPGVVEALEGLRADGHSLGLCTNKPMVPTLALLRHLDLERFFTNILCGDSLPQHKPDPAPLHATFAMGDGARIYVGDSEVDAETAVRAGVPFLLYTEGYRATPVSDLPHAASFSSFADLPGLVTRLA